ncbi:Cytochrome p450 [Thalictrum thalictroides]|uniref:Cytochrome p450 n=1 Tax=Thalictrum thalictroides TaxID=46969 RepID=A0A7J6WCK0_THATH|nr:Cytochrome p450 [Thalictrum thalictroides]
MEEVQKDVRNIARGKLTLNETDINEMHYLKSVIKETLRLHPPLPLLAPRETMQKIKIQGYDIPDKTQVMINVFQIGRDPKLWDEPEKFCPKRFLNGASVSIDFKGQDFSIYSFRSWKERVPWLIICNTNHRISPFKSSIQI